jgi:phosphoribosylformimino-5-aminoimidazole carboxamide ribotide isomerase
MRVLPVLDLKGGRVVRAAGGRRHEYQPLVSRLSPSCEPLAVAGALRSRYGFDEFYLADLDALAGAAPALDAYAKLRGRGFRLWVDAGVRDAGGVAPLAGAGVESLVVGLETVAGPAELETICAAWGRERVVFSLDLQGGEPMGNATAWRVADAWSVASRAVAAGVRRVLVLDLARVGGGSGTGTEALCARLAAAYPDVELSAGGGVRDAADLRRLERCGVRVALVASALHDGRLALPFVHDPLK